MIAIFHIACTWVVFSLGVLENRFFRGVFVYEGDFFFSIHSPSIVLSIRYGHDFVFSAETANRMFIRDGVLMPMHDGGFGVSVSGMFFFYLLEGFVSSVRDIRTFELFHCPLDFRNFSCNLEVIVYCKFFLY